MLIIKRIKEMPRGVKASVSYFIASMITTGIAYITTPVFTRLLSPEEFGQTSTYFAWIHVLGIIAMFCLSYGVFNNGMVDYPDKRDEYTHSMLSLSNIITILFSIILFAIFPLVRDVLGMDYPLAILMCILFVFQPAYNLWYTKQRYEYKYKSVMIWAIVTAVLPTVVALICILLKPEGDRLYARIFGATVVQIIIYIGFYIYVAHKSHYRVNTSFWKSAVIFNLPLIPHYLSTYILSSSDKLMITNLIGNEQTAFYSVAHSVAAVSIIVWSAMNSSLIPYTYEKCKTKDYSSINKITLPLLTIFAGVCIIVCMFAPEVVKIMSTDEYMEAIYVIPPLIGGLFFQVQYYIYANILYYYKKPKFVMLGSITAMIFNLVLNYFFISYFGYLAAGYTTIFCYMIQAIIDYLGMKKVVKQQIYNMKYILFLSILVVAIALASNLIYGNAILRYIIVFVGLIIAFLFRSKIKTVLFMVRKKD